MDVIKRIKKLMDDREWTCYRLSKEANLSESTITNIFKRNNAPTIPTLEAICKAFKISLVQFFSDGEDSVLTPEQETLLSVWTPLDDEQKRLLVELMRKM